MAVSQDENRARCLNVAKRLEAYAHGEIFLCPECEEHIEPVEPEDCDFQFSISPSFDEDSFDISDAMICPHCKQAIPEDDFEQLSVYDAISDVYDVEYRVGGDGEYRGVRLMIACGGPNIYVDTSTNSVDLHWWTEHASVSLDDTAVQAIDEVWQEMFESCRTI